MFQNRLKDHLEKLYAFHQVAQVGVISEAARQLRMSQSALSHSLITLEAALEIKLLERASRGIRLTAAGKLLFEFTKKLIADLESIETHMRVPSSVNLKKFRVGTHETLAIHIWPAFLSFFSKANPLISISLMSGRVEGLVQGVLKNEFDLAVSVEPLAHRKLTIESIYTGSMGLFVGPNTTLSKYPFLKKNKISRDEINQVPVLTDTFAHIEQGLPIPTFLMRQGLAYHFPFELNSFEAAIRLAAKGQGIAFLPEKNAREAVKMGHLRKIEVKGVTGKSFGKYTICATFLKESPFAQEIRTIVDHLKEGLRTPL